MTVENLEQYLAQYPNPVRALRDLEYPSLYQLPGLRPEWSNWRSEQTLWHKSAALLDQSHHMAGLLLSGPDALKFLNDFGVNNFASFAPNSAKQFVGLNAEGWFVGDAILAQHEPGHFEFMGEPGVLNWLEYQIQSGDYDVEYERWHNSIRRGGAPGREWRYEIQGPAALQVLEVAIGGPVPETKFFHIAEFTIAGKPVRAIRHGMAGQPGFEMFGPWDDGPIVREALMKAGEPLGMQMAGSVAYFTLIESGWIGHPLPAVYTSESTKGYREWLPARNLFSLGGSFDSENIEDHYSSPDELGYGRLVTDNHDFLGRDALKQRGPGKKKKVTLVWDKDDFGSIFTGLLDREEKLPPQYLEVSSSARYSFYQHDAIFDGDKQIGFATHAAYIAPLRAFISLAMIDEEYATPGTEVTQLWGDSLKIPRSQIEPHRQVPVRVTVAPAPYSDFARETYRHY